MNINELVYSLSKQLNISIASIARAINQSPQNFNNKLKRGTLSISELEQIADALNLDFSINYSSTDKNITFRENKIADENILEFVIFCIEKLKDDLKIEGKQAYELLNEQTNLLYPYIVKNYEVLHTQGERYIVNDLKELLSKTSEVTL